MVLFVSGRTQQDRLLVFLLVCGACVIAVASTGVEPGKSAESPETNVSEPSEIPAQVLSILKQRCIVCHGAKDPEADLRLDLLSTNFVKDRAAAERWHDALNRIQRGEMPPDDATDLTADERSTLTKWIRRNLDAAIAAARKSDEGVTLRRLNKDEYRYAMTDLLGVEMDYSAKLPTEPLSQDGFLNDGDTLGMSGLQLETYFQAARDVLSRVLVEGPQPEQTIEVADTPSKSFQKASGFGLPSKRQGRFHYFGMELPAPPPEGPFTIRIRARTERTEEQPVPRIRVQYGNQISGAKPILEVVGEQRVSSSEMVTYEIHGRAEDFPFLDPQITPKSQQFVIISNGLDDGKPTPKVNKKSPPPEDPEFPVIIIESVEFVSQAYESWPPPAHRRILFEADNEGTPEYYKSVLEKFLSRAWRRPVSEEELTTYFQHYQHAHSQTESSVSALRETLATALASPRFLYLIEPAGDQQHRLLNAHELAARLALFLWSSIPDAQLRQFAESGELLEHSVLQSEIERMMADPKFDRFIEQFPTQWLDLGGVDRVAVNPEYYPQFDDRLKPLMVKESQLFFAEILRTDISALHLLDADFTMANATLAKHYGLSGPQSQDFERVSLAGTKRPGGLLGHAAILLANSNGEESHPIKRAVWIRERLLDDPPLPPPPNVPALDSTDPDFAKLSVRRQMELHREDPACNDCHRGIDPWGVALDHYDAVGLWRETLRRPREKKRQKGKSKLQPIPVDASDQLPDGVQLSGLDDLKHYLLKERRDQFTRALVVKLLTYSLGRSLQLADEPVVDELTGRFSENNYRLSALIADIIHSEPFRSK